MGEVSQGSGFGEGGSERDGFGGHVVSGRGGVMVMRVVVVVAVVVAGVVVLARR